MIRDAKRVSTHPRKAVAEATHFDYATVKNNRQGAEVEILVGAGPRGETFARAVHRQGAKFEDHELFLKVLQTRYNTARRFGMPTGVTAVEQCQANGRVEQRVRVLRKRLQIMVEDARRRGTQIKLDRPVAQWAVRHTEWNQNFLVKSDTD